MAIHHDELIVYGTFTECDGVAAKYMARWNGSQWCSFTDAGFSNIVLHAISYKDTLHIIGSFKNLGADSVNYIAKWAGGDYTINCGDDYTGITETVAENTILLYPNPAGDFLYLQIDNLNEKLRVEIIDNTGRLLNSFETKDSQNRIDMSAYARGLYLVRLVGAHKAQTRKVIKQ
jgi:hypothetical protein